MSLNSITTKSSFFVIMIYNYSIKNNWNMLVCSLHLFFAEQYLKVARAYHRNIKLQSVVTEKMAYFFCMHPLSKININ